MLGKTEGRRRRRQTMRCLDGITNLMDMNEPGQTLRDTEAFRGQSMGSRRVGHDLATEQQQRLPKGLPREVKRPKKLPAETFPRKGYIKRCQPKGTIYSHTTKGWRQRHLLSWRKRHFTDFPKIKRLTVCLENGMTLIQQEDGCPVTPRKTHLCWEE